MTANQSETTSPDAKSVELTRLRKARYLATNQRGGTLEIGEGDDATFSPVESRDASGSGTGVAGDGGNRHSIPCDSNSEIRRSFSARSAESSSWSGDPMCNQLTAISSCMLIQAPPSFLRSSRA